MASGPIPGLGASRQKYSWSNDKGCSMKRVNKPKTLAGMPPKQFLRKPRNLAVDDAHGSSFPPPVSRFDCASSDGSSSPSGQPTGSDRIPGYTRSDKWVTVSLNTLSSSDRRSLKRKLLSELDHIRSFVRKLEATDAKRSEFEQNADLGPSNSRLFASLTAENKTPKVDKQFRNSGITSVNDGPSSLKCSKKVESRNGDRKYQHAMGSEKELRQLFKSCNNLLVKLMKHKLGWVFNAPVDVKGLGLHDYYTIVKKPMDLGTVKTRLSKNLYSSPLEFAEEVRLTFNNAMLYNPKGQDVHYMAEQLSRIFEDKWKTIQAQCKSLNKRIKSSQGMDMPAPVSKGTPDLNPAPSSLTAPSSSAPQAHEQRFLERAESMTMHAKPKINTLGSDQDDRSPLSKRTDLERPKMRDMTYEEKRKLSEDLQDMPSEMLESVVHIIRKRNPTLSQQDDEIEVDIESVDLETLWELEDFVAEYKKNLNKDKIRSEIDSRNTAEAGNWTVQHTNIRDVTENPKTTESESYLSRQADHLQRTGSGTSSSSSSGDSGSSSSDSDSGSSSGYGSNTGNSTRIDVV